MHLSSLGDTMVVYYLHGQTSWLKVWVNCRQNTRLINVIPESHLPFVQISSISWEMAIKSWNGIKHDFKEMELEFPSGTLRPEKQDYLFRCSVTLGNFLPEWPRKGCSIIYFPTRFFRNFLKWVIANIFSMVIHFVVV